MSIFPLCSLSWGSTFENESVFSIIWKTVGYELLPSQTLPSQGAHRAALTYVRTGFFLCNSAISHAYYDWAASLHPEQYLLCRRMLCVKPSCPAHSAVLRQDSLGSTPHMEWVPPRCFPAFVKGRPFSSSLGFWELWPFYTKLDYPLESFISLLGCGLFSVSCFPSCSFLLFDPRTAKQRYCRRAEFCPRWWTAWRAREEIKGQWSSRNYPSRPLTLVLFQPHFIAWQVWCEMLCFLASQRDCAGSCDGSDILNHQTSFGLLQMLVWSSGGTGRLVGQGHLSVYSQSRCLRGWHGLQW